MTVRIGTRGSQLALWQATTVARRLEASGVRSELVSITTAGDRLQHASLSQEGGKGLFVKEIEDALLRGEIDLAVHSAKDMSAVLPDGLGIAAALAREDARDAFVLPAGPPRNVSFDDVLSHLGSAPRIATSSVRRVAQLASLLPGATYLPIRGNVDTRLRKLDAGGYDALVLAAAGLARLGLGSRIASAIPVDRSVPAPGQGIIAIEARADDARVTRALAVLHDEDAGIALAAERALVVALGGGCQLPLGALAVRNGTHLTMQAIAASPDGSRIVKARAEGCAADPDGLGRLVASRLAEDGALEVLGAGRS